MYIWNYLSYKSLSWLHSRWNQAVPFYVWSIKACTDSSLWEKCADDPSDYRLNANWVVTSAKTPLQWCSNVYLQHQRALTPLNQWSPSPSLNTPSHLSLSIHLSRTITLDKSGIIHFGKWRKAKLESLVYMICTVQSEHRLNCQSAAEKWKKTLLPGDCVATVG